MSDPFANRDRVAKDSREGHRYSDVDQTPQSQHHTLGKKANQAAPGDHDHEGYAASDHSHEGYAASGHTHDYAPTSHTHSVPDWSSYTPSLTNVAGSVSGRYFRFGDTVVVFVKLTLTAAPTGRIRISLPLDVRSGSATENSCIGSVGANDSNGNRYAGSVMMDPADTPAGVCFQGHNSSVYWNATVPFTWALSDTLSFTATYETDEA